MAISGQISPPTWAEDSKLSQVQIEVRKALTEVGNQLSDLQRQISSVYRASYFAASFSFTANVTSLNPGAKDYDPNNLFNTTHAAAFTCPIAGYLTINLTLSTGSGTGHNYNIYQNGVKGRFLFTTASATASGTGQMTILAAKGDYFEIKTDLNVTDTNLTLQFLLEAI